MKIKFKNARILKTLDHDFEILQGQLIVEDNRIKSIITGDAATESAEDKEYDKIYDCDNNLLIPGFKNAHTHTAMTFLRSHADDLPLQEWLFDKVFPKEDQLTEEFVYIFDIIGIMEYLSSGITSNFDMYFFPPKNAKASIDCGFRTVQTSGFNNFGADIKSLEDNYLKVNELSPLSSFIVGFHAEYTTSMERMEQVAALVEKYKSPMFVHNSETENEVKECVERWGKTPTQLFDSLGMYKYGGGGYHCVWFDDEDFRIFKDKGLYAVTNPSSNLKLASGIAPLKRFYDEGINVAIGTDGAASNNALDFFREMYLAAVLAKVREMDASAVDAKEILYSATYQGAHSMGLGECDCLKEGNLADIVMIDMHAPNMQPEHNIIKNLVYAGSKSNVLMTMVDGKVLYENGKYNIGFDKEEIYTKANEIVRGMK